MSALPSYLLYTSKGSFSLMLNANWCINEVLTVKLVFNQGVAITSPSV